MTVSAKTNKSTYASNGSTATYSTVLTFAAIDEVTGTKVVTPTGVETEFTLGTEYTLIGAGTGSVGTVTISTSPTDYRPASGTKLVIQLKPDFKQIIKKNRRRAFYVVKSKSSGDFNENDSLADSVRGSSHIR